VNKPSGDRNPAPLAGLARLAVGGIALLLILGCPEDPPTAPTVEGLAGIGGVALFVEGSLDGWTLEALDDDGGTRPLDPGPSPVIDPEGSASTTYTLSADGASILEVAPRELALVDTTSPSPPILLADEALELGLALDGGDASLARGNLLVRRVSDTGEITYLNPGCLEGTLEAACWHGELLTLVDEVSVLELGDHTFSLPPYTPAAGEPRTARFGPYLQVVDDQGQEVLAGKDLRAIFVGRTLGFGDLHAHTNLSGDGCEDIEDRCGNRGDYPGQDHFETALGADLDFAAITDHGEWDVLHQEGEAPIEIWDATVDLVSAALPLEDEGFVPFLGYEWTNFVNVLDQMGEGETGDDYRDQLVAGHKTVLFRQTSACQDYRIGSESETPILIKGDSGQSYSKFGDKVEATTVADFHAAMDAAEGACGALDWMTFFHHSGYLVPTPVDWALPANEPDPEVERLVEISSEHGSSECRDPTQDGCDFRVTDEDFHEHLGWGSVQEALSLGYRLGFLGGTDSHDGRPGTLGDGPSWVGIFQDLDGDGQADEAIQLFHDGALTGVFAEPPLDRVALWDALYDRNTLATTGPRGRLAMAAVTEDGLAALPGDELVADVFPLALTVVAEPDGPYQVDRIEVVEPEGGTVLHQAEGGSLVVDLEDPGTDAVYVRVRLWDGGDEHRVWFSPLFIVR